MSLEASRRSGVGRRQCLVAVGLATFATTHRNCLWPAGWRQALTQQAVSYLGWVACHALTQQDCLSKQDKERENRKWASIRKAVPVMDWVGKVC